MIIGWSIRFDEVEEKFVCSALDGELVLDPEGVDGIEENVRREFIAKALDVANERKLRLVSAVDRAGELMLFFHSE